MNIFLRSSGIISLAVLSVFSTVSSRATTLFTSTFQPPVTTGDQPISSVGWVNDIQTTNSRLAFGSNFANKTSSDYSVWSYCNAGFTEAFYTTTSNSAGFAAIDLSQTTGLTFSADIESGYNAGNTVGYFAVKMSSGSWYVSATALPTPTGTWTTQNLVFNATAANWKSLTIPTEGTDSVGTGATIGATAGADLSGSIVGVGFVVNHFNADGTLNIDNFTVAGTVSAVPEPSTYAMFGGVAALGLALWSRRRRA